MNQHQLMYFLEVYYLGNISQAAKKLYVSPQSVSQTIIGLEKELDQKLFDRSGKKMVPTKTAVRLSAHAERILEEYQYILSNNFPNSEERRTVVMACCYDAPQSLGIEFYHRLQVEHPDIVFRLEEMPDPDAIAKLENNQVEMAIVPGPINTSQYQIQYLSSQRLCMLFNREHPMAGHEVFTIEDFQKIKNTPIAVKSQKLFGSMEQNNLLTSLGLTPNYILEVSDYHIIHEMVENNYSAGMTLDILADQLDPAKATSAPIQDSAFEKNLYLVKKRGYRLSEESEIIEQEILRSFGKLDSKGTS